MYSNLYTLFPFIYLFNPFLGLYLLLFLVAPSPEQIFNK